MNTEEQGAIVGVVRAELLGAVRRMLDYLADVPSTVEKSTIDQAYEAIREAVNMANVATDTLFTFYGQMRWLQDVLTHASEAKDKKDPASGINVNAALSLIDGWASRLFHVKLGLVASHTRLKGGR